MGNNFKLVKIFFHRFYFQRSRDFHVWNSGHLGDQIWTLNILKKISKSNQNIKFIYYVKNKRNYPEELSQWLIGMENRIEVLPIDSKPEKSLNLWIGDWGYFTHPNRYKYDQYYFDYTKLLCSKLRLTNPLKTINDLFFDDVSPLSYPDIDVLFINSKPLSNQITQSYNSECLIINYLINQNFKVAITSPIKITDVYDTTEFKLSTFDIARLSCNAKWIIGINTGPFHGCFNSWNKERALGWITIDEKTGYYFNKRCHHARNWEESIELVKNLVRNS